MLRVFIGSDPRQQIGPQVLAHSIAWRSSKPVSITYLVLDQLPIKRMGLTQFTFSRYLVPYLCDYQGIALFLDADMLVQGDIAELFSLKDSSAVQVVKNAQRFEWPSMMLFDNSQCTRLTPEYIERGSPQSFEWAETVGDLPAEWNLCVGYDQPNPDAKLIHYTQGLPIWPETKGCEHSKAWLDELNLCNSSVSFQELMGNSVHAKHVYKRLGKSD
jgi:hypothetical protein